MPFVKSRFPIRRNRGSLYYAALSRKTFPLRVRGTADPSAIDGMTKERATAPERVIAGPRRFHPDDESAICPRNHFPRNRHPFLCHPEQLTCLRQVEGEMTRQDRCRCKARRADRQTSAQPGRAGKSGRGSERRRRGTKPIVRSRCVIRSEAEGSAVPRTLSGNAFRFFSVAQMSVARLKAVPHGPESFSRSGRRCRSLGCRRCRSGRSFAVPGRNLGSS